MVGTIIWAADNSAHYNHIHVEPVAVKSGTPPKLNPGKTPGVQAIYDALEKEFGKGAYFLGGPEGKTPIQEIDPSVKWTHMGGWNRRYIGTGTTWSQHAWWNALDIGPYYGTGEQKVFYDFLLSLNEKEDDMAFTAEEEKVLKQFVAELASVGSGAAFVSAGNLIADIRKDIVTKDELNTALAALPKATLAKGSKFTVEVV